MPRKKKKNYFGENEEQAVVDYLNAKTFAEKDRIYREHLREPIDKMIESIIRRYKLYRDTYDFETLHVDVSSFLVTKFHKFKPERNKKAYSYFGTICKNYLMGAIIKDKKEIQKTVSYEDISTSVEEHPDMVYHIDDDGIDHYRLIDELVRQLEDFIEDNELNDNELKLGYGLIELFSNYDTIFQAGSGNKFNKNLILHSLREITSLSTKEIRSSMKKYTVIYEDIVTVFINE